MAKAKEEPRKLSKKELEKYHRQARAICIGAMILWGILLLLVGAAIIYDSLEAAHHPDALFKGAASTVLVFVSIPLFIISGITQLLQLRFILHRKYIFEVSTIICFITPIVLFFLVRQ